MLSSADVPHLLKRSHIVHGYRPLHQPRHYYVKSAFTFHNELVNVWTHFLPAVYLLAFYLLPELLSPNSRFACLVLYFGTFALMLCSSGAHLLHSRSPLDHVFWFLIDFSGIALFSLTIGLQRFACNYEMGFLMKIGYLPSLLVVVLGLQYFSTCYLFVVHPQWKYRHQIRLVTCLILGVWLNVPLISRFLTSDPQMDSALHYHGRAFLWLLVSGIFMGGNVPERFAPGRFDLFGYGHQLFHLCVNMLAWNLCDAAHQDASYDANRWSTPCNVALSLCVVIALGFIVANVVAMMQKARKHKYE